MVFVTLEGLNCHIFILWGELMCVVLRAMPMGAACKPMVRYAAESVGSLVGLPLSDWVVELVKTGDH